MKILLILLLLPVLCFGQTKLVPVKKNGKYMAPLVFPLTSEVEIDSTNFWKPKPTIPPTNDDTTKIDARNATYSTGWYNDFTRNSAGQVVNVGWYKNTIALSNVANTTATFRFQGSKIELWGEKKTSHGTGVITLRRGTTIVETKNVSFIGPTQLPSLIYTNTASLTLGTVYTLELKVTSGYNLIDFFVVKDYTQVIGGTDPPVEPPVEPPIGDYINVTPNQDYRNIINTASKNVRLSPGTYTGPFNLPAGRSMECDNATLINSITGYENSAAANKVAILNLNSSSKTNGAQTIRGCIIDGRDLSYAGIMSSNRDNVVIERCTIKNNNFTGVWLTNSSGAKVTNNIFDNTGWADERYITGALMINNISDALIEANTFRSNKNSKGSGIESNSLVSNSTLTRIKILNNKFELSKHNPWNNGASQNFAIELHNTYTRGIEIAYNNLQNEISFASHKPGDGSKNWIHHNTGNLSGNLFFVETVADDFLIENNTPNGSAMFIVNYQPNGVWKNWVVRNNTHTNGAPPSWGAGVLIGPNGVQNVLLENNVLPNPVIKYMGTTGGVTIR